MKFSELETIMTSRGINALAEIARTLGTTPQAVSNWKARDQVPHHIVSKINNLTSTADKVLTDNKSNNSNFIIEDQSTLSDILVVIAKQLKVIFLTIIITVFTVVTYSWANYELKYVSTAKLLLPENKGIGSGLSGISSIAGQFGVNLGSNRGVTDLTSPSLFPELVNSLTFGELILFEEFFSKKHKQKISLFKLLTDEEQLNNLEYEIQKRKAIESFHKMVNFQNEGSFSLLVVTANEPALARDINLKVLEKLQELNHFYTNQKLAEKIRFINTRILSVGQELENSEQKLKFFRESNRQVSSPALILEEERLSRDVEIQKEIFLTLKQQSELANIENIQNETVIQILDKPQLPIVGSAESLKLVLLLSIIIGIILGVIFAFVRSYLNDSDINERRKLRRAKNFVKKKGQEIFSDRRVSGIITIMMLLGLPYSLGHKSANPTYFDMYSSRLMFLNLIYLLLLIFFASQFIYLTKRKQNKTN